jgi:hypothetical protein
MGVRMQTAKQLAAKPAEIGTLSSAKMMKVCHIILSDSDKISLYNTKQSSLYNTKQSI